MQTMDAVANVPAREGHFLLESGYHTHLWLTLDGLFVSPRDSAPAVDALAGRLERYEIRGVCGPLLGGAFLAQALADALDVEFYFTVPIARSSETGMFPARYQLPSVLHARVRDRRIAVVDDVISAGSSVRATLDAIAEAGGEVAVIGTLLTLGTIGSDDFRARGIPLESLGTRDFSMWKPAECPLCAARTPLERP